MPASGAEHVQEQPSSRPYAAFDRRVAIALFGVGLLLRLLMALLRGTPLFSDEIKYLSMARDILETGTHTLHFFWPSGYGYFAALVLLVTGDAPRAVLIAQALLSAAIGPMVYALAVRSGTGRPASAAAASFYVILIQPWLMVGLFLSDTFFTATTLAAMLLLLREDAGRIPIHLVAGFLLGWAWTSRSVGLVAVGIGIALTLTRPLAVRRRIILALCVAATVSVPVGFVLARNWRAHHVLALEVNAGMNLWRGNNPDTDMRHAADQVFPSLPGETLAQSEARARREATAYILRHPGVFAGRCVIRLSQILGPNPGREIIHAFRNRIGMRPIVGLHLVESILLWSVALGGLALAIPRNRVFRTCALYALIYATLVATVIAVPRYRLPMIPFVCVLFAGGLQALIDIRADGRPIRRNRRLWIAGIVTLIVIANSGWQIARELPKASGSTYQEPQP